MTRIAITGHRGLAAEVEAIIDRVLRTELAPFADSDLVGVSCLADGADQIFAQAVLEAGGKLEVVVPAAGYRDALPTHAQEGYDRLLMRAGAVQCLDHVDSTSESHMEASVEIIKRADLLFAVWDGLPARSFGGTADVVAHAEQVAVPVTIVWPAGAHRG